MKKNLLLTIVFFVVSFAYAQPTDVYVDDAPQNYEDAEVRPEFPGGFSAFMTFIGKNYKMPEYEGSGGTMKIAFIIEADGTITNVKIVKDLGDGTGAEAKRVISMSPKWTPGEFRGKKVRILYELPMKIAGQG